MAVRFDAVSEDYSRALSLGSQTALTACCWFKVSVDRNTWSSAFFIDNGQADNWGVQTAEDGVTVGTVLDGNSTTGFAATVGTWYFICFASSGTTGTLYRKAAGDTSLSTTAITGVTATNAATLRLGRSPWDGEWLNGSLAAVKVWNVQLTQAEIELEAAQYLPNKVASLVSFHPLVRAETTDYSGNARTLSGGTGATTEDGPPIPWWVSSPRITLPATAGGGPHIVAVGQVTETDSATATARQKLKAIGQSSETETAQSLTVVKRRSIGQVVESTSAFSVSRRKTRTIGQVTESSASQLTRVVKVRAVGFVTETDTVTPVVRPGVVTAVTETDTALSVRAIKVRTVGLVTETSTVQALTARHTRVIGQISETSTPFQLTRLKQRTTGFVTETDSLFAAARVKSRTVGLATETDLSLGVSGGAQVVPIGAVTETDTAQSIRSKRITRRPSSGVTLRPNTGITARP